MNHSYADSGIFCIHAACDPSQLRELVEIVTTELVAMKGSIITVEFNRSMGMGTDGGEDGE